MTEQIIGAVLAGPAAGNGMPDAAHRDTNTARVLQPNTWLNGNPTIEYDRAYSFDQGMRGVFLDNWPQGLAMNIEDASTLTSWHHPCVVKFAGS